MEGHWSDEIWVFLDLITHCHRCLAQSCYSLHPPINALPNQIIFSKNWRLSDFAQPNVPMEPFRQG